MANHIIIDGYNLIGLREGLGSDLELKREQLIEELATYRNIKKLAVTIVFDGWETGTLRESKATIRGIKVVFSRRGEKADQVIGRMVSKERERCIVVTSDRAVQERAVSEGAVTVSSEEFYQLLIMANYSHNETFTEEDDFGSITATKKKGNPRRLSKAERKKKRKLKKL
jgi:predicted RNA-binding protein with PIN domain